MSLPDPLLQPEFYAFIPVKRSIAWVVDLVITLGLSLVGVVLTVFLGLFFFPVLFLAVSIAYRTVMLSRYEATLGMMLAAIRLRRLDGSRLDTGSALAYSVLHAGVMMFVLTQIASIVTILVTPYRQGLHDLVLRTTMLGIEAPARH